jgi:hypothetical protein
MSNEDFVRSVERHIVQAASTTFTNKLFILLMNGDPEGVDITERQGMDIEELVSRAIQGSFDLVNEHLKLPRMGTMTFDDAMRAIVSGEAMTRPNWDIDRHLRAGGTMESIEGGEFRVLGNSVVDRCNHYWEFYRPSEDDRTAADWMKFEPAPEFRLDLSAFNGSSG